MRVFVGKNVLLPREDHPRPATILVDTATGKITDVLPRVCTRDEYPDVVDEEDWVDAGESVIMPGIVDAHVHLNEPGRTHWEGFWTGTRAAASGGVTTLVDMPLNSIPPTTTVANLDAKRAAASGQCWVDVAFWGGVVPGNQAELKPLVAAGVRGFKCFLIESGVEEFPCVSEHDVELAMQELEGTDTVLCFHAEVDDSPRAANNAQPAASDANPTLYTTFLSSRPPDLEVNAIALITRLAAQHRSLRTHIVHLSAASALPFIRLAKAARLPFTVETCFHYLTLAADAIPDGQPEFKCCPPVRDAANREALWAALRAGEIDCVVSDHSPCVAALKRCRPDGAHAHADPDPDADGDIMRAWGGISTLGLGLSLLWTEARARGVPMGALVKWLCARTAAHAGLDDRKGAIRAGWDADLVLWDPEAQFTVTREALHFKNKLTPYEGRVLRGRVRRTFLRGALVYDADADATEGGFVGGPRGMLL